MSDAQVKFKINPNKLKDKKIALIKANFNNQITDEMLKQAQEALKKYEVTYDIFEVPGSFEIAYQIKKINKDFDGFVAIGCLIKGETLHFEYIAESASQGLMDLSVALTKPIGFAILTCLNQKQAEARLDLGAQATKTVLQLISK